MDLLVYEKDCAELDLSRPRLEMLKTNVFEIAVHVDRVVLIMKDNRVFELKNRTGEKNFNLILKN